MKLGINLWTVYGWRPIRPLETDVIERLGRLGYQTLELIMGEERNTPDDLIERRDEIADAVGSAGMTISSVATTVFGRYSLATQDEGVRTDALDWGRRGLEVTKAYGAPVLLVVAGKQEPGVPYAQTYATALESVRALGEAGARVGVTIGVENVPGSFLTSPLEYAQFVRDAGHPSVRAYLDVGNGAAVGPSFAENWITATGEAIAIVHAKDVDLRTGASVCCGLGHLSWSTVRAELESVGYTGPLVVETPPLGGVGEIDPDVGLFAAETSLAGLRRFFEEVGE
jgi:sugar phosphate isomerase/epimerase